MVNLPGAGGFLDVERITAAMGLVAGMKVADLGCGSGYFPITIARAVGPQGLVTAVDVQEAPLQAVREKAEAAGMGNIRDIRADLEVLGSTGMPNNSHDVSLLANVLFQSQKKDAIITEAVRVLKPGGHIILIDWRKGIPGFGPPEQLRTAEEDMKALVQAQGMQFERTLDAGKFHYGLVFQKP